MHKCIYIYIYIYIHTSLMYIYIYVLFYFVLAHHSHICSPTTGSHSHKQSIISIVNKYSSLGSGTMLAGIE